MPELIHQILAGLAVFVVVFILNVVPAFAPPTWTVLSFIAIKYRVNVLVLSVVGATAATAGRSVLARLSRWLVAQKLLSERSRENIDQLRIRLEGKKRLTAGAFLLYAFSPFPSNHLFIAYGLTGLRLRLVVIPFLFGRLVSYTFWAATASEVGRVMAYQAIEKGTFFSYYFVLTQAFTILSIYLFTKIDWRKLLTQKKIGLIGRGQPDSGVADAGQHPDRK